MFMEKNPDIYLHDPGGVVCLFTTVFLCAFAPAGVTANNPNQKHDSGGVTYL